MLENMKILRKNWVLYLFLLISQSSYILIFCLLFLYFEIRKKGVNLLKFSNIRCRSSQKCSTKNEWKDDAICRLPYWHIINERQYKRVNQFTMSSMSPSSRIMYSQCQITNVREPISGLKRNDIFCRRIRMKVEMIFEQTILARQI